jgi:hypothetical protein
MGMPPWRQACRQRRHDLALATVKALVAPLGCVRNGPLQRIRLVRLKALRRCAVEMAKFDHAWGQGFVRRIKIQSQKTLIEILRRIGDYGLDVAKEGAGHAVPGRRPAW